MILLITFILGDQDVPCSELYHYELEANTSMSTTIMTHRRSIRKARKMGNKSLTLSFVMPWFIASDKKQKVVSIQLPSLEPSYEEWVQLDKKLSKLFSEG